MMETIRVYADNRSARLYLHRFFMIDQYKSSVVFEIGQLVYVKSVSDRVYLGMVMKNILYLNNFEDAFYEIYLVGSGEKVRPPLLLCRFRKIGLEITASNPNLPYWPDEDEN